MEQRNEEEQTHGKLKMLSGARTYISEDHWKLPQTAKSSLIASSLDEGSRLKKKNGGILLLLWNYGTSENCHTIIPKLRVELWS